MKSIYILEQIGELSAEADWTDEELDAALLENGVDPNTLVHSVMTEIAPFLENRRETSSVIDCGVGGSLPLIELFRKSTNLSLSAIAKVLNVSTGFLTEIARHPTAIPQKWREELIIRATHGLHIDQTLIYQALMTALPERGLALSQGYRPADVITYRGILDRSGMTSNEKQFWLNLASQEHAD
jgi:hypothetical protein